MMAQQEGRRRGGSGTVPYSSAVRRWICIIALLTGFTSQDYIRFARAPRAITPTEQPYDRLPWRGPEVQPWDWWLVR